MCTGPVTLTNANRQALQVVPWTSHSALVLSILALLVASKGEVCYPTTTSNLLIHLIPAVPRHQLALWVVPLYWSGHWSCRLHTVHPLITSRDGQCHIRIWVRQACAIILQESSRHWSERRRKEEERLRQSTMVYSVCCLPRACSNIIATKPTKHHNFRIYLSCSCE